MGGHIWIRLIMLGGLLICAVIDWRTKKVYIPIVSGVSGVLLLAQGIAGELSVSMVAGAFVVCGIFCGLSILTAGQIGIGDGMLFGMTGVGLGVIDNIQMILYCFTETFLVALFLTVVCHKKKSFRIPMAPFMVISSILVIV